MHSVYPRININGGGVHQWYLTVGQQCTVSFVKLFKIKRCGAPWYNTLGGTLIYDHFTSNDSKSVISVIIFTITISDLFSISSLTISIPPLVMNSSTDDGCPLSKDPRAYNTLR